MNKTSSEFNKKLIDFAGREINYLRVALTQRCNLRCNYCFGSYDGNNSEIAELTNEEIIKLIHSFASLGISKVRFTGGEPLLRSEIVSLIQKTSEVPNITAIGITTNGLSLKRLLPELIQAGMNQINISLDSMNRNVFRNITGVDGLSKVLAGIEAALECGAFKIVKVNTVVIHGVNDGEIQAMARWALNKKIDIRFIEIMPTEKSNWSKERFVSEFQIREKIGLDLKPEINAAPGCGPAITFSCQDYPGRISFISAVSRNFCGKCNRLRLTARGEIYGCLFKNRSASLIDVLRNGDTIEQMANHINEILARPGFRRTPDGVSVTDYKPFMQAVGG